MTAKMRSRGIAFCSSYWKFELTPVRVSGVVLHKNNLFFDVVNFIGYFTVYFIFVNQNCEHLELSSLNPLEGMNTQQNIGMFSYLLNDQFTDRIMVKVKVENKNCLYMGLKFSERHLVIIFSHKYDMVYCVSSEKSWIYLR